MKVNDSLLVLSLSNALQSTSSLTKSIELIYHLNLINEEKYHKILSSLKEEYSIMQILLILEIDKSLIQYTLFYNNYYSLAISLKMSSSIVSEIKSFKSEIISSLIYPTILIILSFIALLFVSNFIIPQLVILNPNSMQNFNLIITILNILPIFILILVSFSITSLIITKIMLKKDYKKTIIQLINIPIISKVIKFYCSISFIVYLKETTKNIPFNYNCITILNKQIDNKVVSLLLDEMLVELNRGYNIVDIIKESSYLNNDLKYIIQSSINSKEMSVQLNNFYNLKITILKKRMKMFISILVPIVVSLIGILLIIMYILIMMPILNMDLDI